MKKIVRLRYQKLIYICISKNTRFFITEPKRYHVAKSVFNKMLMIFDFTYLIFYEKNCQNPLSKVIAIFPILIFLTKFRREKGVKMIIKKTMSLIKNRVFCLM